MRRQSGSFFSTIAASTSRGTCRIYREKEKQIEGEGKRDEKFGVARVREALESKFWPNMQKKEEQK